MDVSRADGELRCPMAGEGQHVTVAQPHAVYGGKNQMYKRRAATER